MTYVVLARKWRPQTFEDLTGQEHVARTLANAIEQERVPHAMLFTGARGVGKTSTARILAMALNCAEGPTVKPCGTCDACKEIQQSNSLDVLEIDGASNRGINEIRELRDGVRYAPHRDGHKIYIIDEVHMLTTEAFNALLKTLEEPPPHVVFIFATTEAHKIPVTILSRCQRFDFRRIPFAAIVGRLERIAAAEELAVDAEVLGVIARQAAGGMRDALSLMDQVIAFAGTTVSLEAASSILGVAERRRLFELSAALLARDVDKALSVIDEVDAFGVDLAHFASEFVAHLRDLAVIAVTSDPEGLTSLTDNELAEARAQLSGTDAATVHRMFDLMVGAAEQISRSAHARLVLEMSLVRLGALEPLHAIEDLAARLEQFARGEKLPAPTGGGQSGTGGTSKRREPAEPVATDAATRSASASANASDPARPVAEVTPPPQPDPQPQPEPVGASEPMPAEAAPSDAGSTNDRAVDTPPPIEHDSAESPTSSPVADSEEPAATAAAEVGAPDSTASLDATHWREVVDAMRESAPGGELLASVTALPDDNGRVKLAVNSALAERVDEQLIVRLNALCRSKVGHDHEFDIVHAEDVDEVTLANGYSVARDEEEAEQQRRATAAEYVRGHAATALVMSTWPGSQLQEIRIPEPPKESIR